MADSYLDTAGGMQQVPDVNIVQKPEQPYTATDGSMQSALAVNVGAGGEIISAGDPVTVDPANDQTPSYVGTFHDTTPPSVTLPATVAMTPDGGAVGIWNASDDSRGNGSAFVNQGALTAVRLAAQNDVVGNGATKPLSKADNTGLLAMITANVPAATNTLESWALPHNYAVLEGADENHVVNQYDGTGDAAMSIAVGDNEPVFTLANSTSRIVFDQQQVTVENSTHSKSVTGTIGIDQGALNGVGLNVTTALVEDADALQVPVSGTYIDTVTFTVSGGVITAITLS